jgi:uroporphyrinogen-III decarboxylase
MGELGCDMVDIDFLVPLEKARSTMGPLQTLAGNLDPVRDICNGTPESITHALEALQQQAGARCVVAAGCEIARGTPHENLRALVNFAQTHAAA